MDKKATVPLYMQLMEDLMKKINSKQYKENDRLPSERELCEIYNLSRITVRQALQELEREGYIYKLHGKGTFVHPKYYDQHLKALYSFTDEMLKIGKTPKTRVLDFQEMRIEENLASIMGLVPGEHVYRVVRLRLADEEPLIYETSYIPKKLFPSLKVDHLNERPMYTVFKSDFNIVVTKAMEKFSATLVKHEESKLLKVPHYSSALFIKRFAYFNDELIEYTISVARGDKFTYTVELS